MEHLDKIIEAHFAALPFAVKVRPDPIRHAAALDVAYIAYTGFTEAIEPACVFSYINLLQMNSREHEKCFKEAIKRVWQVIFDAQLQFSLDHLSKPTIAFDIDFTLAMPTQQRENFGSDWDAYYMSMRPSKGVPALKEISDKYPEYDIVLHTARPLASYFATKDWLDLHDVYYDNLAFGKPKAEIYYDDKARPYYENITTSSMILNDIRILKERKQ